MTCRLAGLTRSRSLISHRRPVASLCAVLSVLPTVGGPSSGSVDDGSAGWSFEFTLKPGMQSQWAKIMDLGSTRNVSNILQCNNDIAFGCTHTLIRT